MKRRRVWLPVVLGLVVVGVAACGGDDAEAKAKAKAASTTIFVRPTLPATTTTLDAAHRGALLDATQPLADLAALVQHPLELTSVSISFNSISVVVRQGGNPNNLDSYTYQPIIVPKAPVIKPTTTVKKTAGSTTATTRKPLPTTTTTPKPFPGSPLTKGWGSPRPISMSTKAIAELPTRIFSAADVNWAAVPQIAAQGIGMFQELEQPQVGGVSFSKQIVSTYFVLGFKGVRGSGFIRADARGTIIASGRS